MSDAQDNNQQDFQIVQEEPVYVEDQDHCAPPPLEQTDIFQHLIKKNKNELNSTEDLHMMILDLDYEIGPNQTPKIRIFGTTQQGQSICCFVNNFKPYFFVPSLASLSPSQNNANHITNELNVFGKSSNDIKTGQGIQKIEFVHKRSIREYCSNEEAQNKTPNFMKIYTKNPPLVNKFRHVFQHGFKISNDMFPFQTYESNIPYVLRFLVDKGIVGMGWVKIRGSNYQISPEDKKRTICQLQIQCDQSAVQAVSGSTRWDKLAPLKILSFDIQCGAQRGFPDQNRDPIITIGIVCKTTGQESVKKIVLTLNSCLPIPGVQVVSQQSEKTLLERFQQVVRMFDPDFIIGYNMINFDFKYIMGRAQALKMKTFGYFGRMKYTRSTVKKERYLSKVMGMRQTYQISIIGRIKLDLMIHMHGQHQLSSYSLNSVSAIFLNQQKQDVHHSQIYGLFKKSDETRKRLAEYCVKDAYLPLKLMQKLMCLYNYTQMARVTGVPINFLFKRGQQIKVVSQILRKIRDLDLLIPSETSKGNAKGQVGFQGAYVLEPKVGFYTHPVATLDFASLYPSIMMAHNLCYTTLLTARDVQRLGYKENVQYQKTVNGMMFVKNQTKRGILPSILFDLISARKKAKQQLAKATSDELRAVLDGRQLALKISANSVYGFTGALIGQLPCLEISGTVTAIGRNLIDFTSKLVVQLFPGSQVLYGDTDSVMVKFPLVQLQDVPNRGQLMRAEAMEYGKKAAQMITQRINKPPIKLQFQKVYSPFLLMSKKRYSGMLYTNPIKCDKVDKKGFESVRRDNCHLIRQILQTILKKLFDGNNIKECVDYIKKKISDLLMNKIDLSELIITKSINKKIGEEDDPKKKGQANKYKVRQAHVELAQRMMKRNPQRIIQIGDRIPYIIVRGTKGSKNYQNAEDPERVQQQDLPIDFDYYIDKQIRPPLERLLVDTGIVSNIDPVFNGEHTVNRYVPRLKQSTIGLGAFVKAVNKCVGCKTASKECLCESCKQNHIDIYLSHLSIRQKQLQAYSKLWTHCQQCQGSLINQNICSNSDCKIYFKRGKVKKQIIEKQEEIQKLKNLSW